MLKDDYKHPESPDDGDVYKTSSLDRSGEKNAGSGKEIPTTAQRTARSYEIVSG